MWRMQRADGLTSHLVLKRLAKGVCGVWFLNKTPLGVRDFSDMRTAIQWADRMQTQSWSTGWRLVSDDEPRD